MTNVCKQIITIIILSIISFSGHGRNLSPFYFSHLGVEDGLSQVTVLDVFQDSDGYIWFGTRNGANRYDGYEFKVYRNEVNNPGSISDNCILRINEDRNKNLWLATVNGINCIDYKTQQLSRFYPCEVGTQTSDNTVLNFLRHSDGELYACTRQCIFRCDPEKSLEEMPWLKEVKDSVYSIIQDSEGDIFVGTDLMGLYMFSSDWKLKKHWLPDSTENPRTLQTNMITTLFAGPDGNIFIGILDNGLCVYNKKKDSFTRMNTSNSGLSSNTIRRFIPYGKDSILIGTFRGLNILDTKKMTISPISINIKEEGALSHYSVHGMLIDRNQTLWVGTYSAGVNYHSPFYNPTLFIKPNSFSGIVGIGKEDKHRNMWFATEGTGLFFYNPDSGEQKSYPIKPIQEGNYAANIIKSITIEGDSIYCATHFGAVYLFSIPDKKYTKIHDYKYNDINTLFIDSKQRLWIPTHTEHHTVLVDKGTKINTFKTDKGEKIFKGISLIKELTPGTFLFGTNNDSVFLYDMENEKLTDLTVRLNNGEREKQPGKISGALTDSEQYLWIATTKSGLFRLDRNLNLIQNYQKEDGLSESYIHSLTIDKDEDIWVVTGKDLYKLNRMKNTFEHIKPANVPTQEYSLFANNSVATDGTLYFSGNLGILALNPRNNITDPTIPPIYITSLLVNDQKGREDTTEDVELFPRQYDHHIRLSSDQKNITIRFTALNFINSQNNSYTHIMEGVDTKWNNTGNRREVYYSNLSPGKYTFRVKTANDNGIRNSREAVLHIIIDPPFYKTWWAYLIYVCVISLIITMIVRRQQHIQERKREERYKLLEQKRMNELHEERMRMFTNFSHELRTPLTLIINLLNDLLQRLSFSPEIKGALYTARKNTDRMLLLVNNLMDIQKYEAGKSVLQKSRFNFSELILKIYQSFRSVAANRGIGFTLDNKLPESFFTRYDKAEIEKVFFNLLSNAFKFTHSGGRVTIIVRRIDLADCEKLTAFQNSETFRLVENSYLYIEIADTGKGFSQEDANKIFDPFFRSEEDVHKQIPGSGIGLSLTRSIVTQHQGCIRVESSVGSGARFMFLLPDTEKQEEQEDSIFLTPSSETNHKVALLVEEAETRNKQTVLLVDDNQDILDYLEQQLQHDYIVMKASNGKKALEQIAKTEPHIVVSDVMMPEISGLELCRRIKGDEKLCHIPVILLTAKSFISQIEEGLETGADDYITKPFYISLLKARIKNILSLREKMNNNGGESLTLKQLGIKEPQENDDFLNQYIEIVKANISNPELDVSVIYQALGMSRANFYRKVKTTTGLSPIELIRNIRLQAGSKLLKESNMNVSEVAQHIGFSSRSYFARSFKAAYGISPTEYQEKHKPS